MATKFSPFTGTLDYIGTGNASTLYLGDPNTDGSWRVTVSGSNLNFERRESGVWVEKSAATP